MLCCLRGLVTHCYHWSHCQHHSLRTGLAGGTLVTCYQHANFTTPLPGLQSCVYCAHICSDTHWGLTTHSQGTCLVRGNMLACSANSILLIDTSHFKQGSILYSSTSNYTLLHFLVNFRVNFFVIKIYYSSSNIFPPNYTEHFIQY